MIFCRHRKCRTKLKRPVSNKPRGLLCPRLSYQFLSKALPGLRGADTAQKQNAKGLPEIAVPQRLAGQSWLRPLPPINRR